MVDMHADEMGVGPSGSKKKDFHKTNKVSVQAEEVTWLEEKVMAMTVTYSGCSVCTKDTVSFQCDVFS